MIKIMRALGFSLRTLNEFNTTLHKSNMLSAEINRENGPAGKRLSSFRKEF
jgi:hypothetical protein